MLTLTVTAETMPELIQKTLDAIGVQVAVNAAGAASATAPTAAGGKPKRAPKATGKVVQLDGTDATAAEATAAAATSTETTPDVETLIARFRQLVVDDYERAAKILSDLGVETFAEVVAGDLLRELAAKLDTP